MATKDGASIDRGSVQDVALNNKPTFSYAIANFTPATKPTDMITLSGAPDVVLRITLVRISADADAVGSYPFYAIKRTSKNAGGKAVIPKPVLHDSKEIPKEAKGVLRQYTVNPTKLGNGVLIRAEHFAISALQFTGYPFNPIVWFQGNVNSKCITLYDGELLAINGNGLGPPKGMTVFCALEWTEDVD